MKIQLEKDKIEKIKLQVDSSTEFKQALEYFDEHDAYKSQDDSFEITANVKEDFDNSFTPPNSSKNATDMKYLLGSNKSKTTCEVINLEEEIKPYKGFTEEKSSSFSLFCCLPNKHKHHKFDYIDYNNLSNVENKI